VDANALSRKSVLTTADWLVADFERMGISHYFAGVENEETQSIVQSGIPDSVREAQQIDQFLQVRAHILEGRTREFTIDGTQAILFHGRPCVPQKS
jgi:hypothetical protein